MISIRQRRGVKTTEVPEDYAAQEANVTLESKLPSGGTSRRLWKLLSLMVGGTIALCIGLLTSVYLATLHENDLWFSNIKVWSYYCCMISSSVSPVVKCVDEG
uniref:Dpy-19 like C-mannosyltransferase 3 n=1 Tax=Panthera leo TaxID=9689 RepID=A0A8C8XDN3_PANLE